MITNKNLYKGNLKGYIFYKSFLLAHWTAGNRFKRIVFLPIWLSYRFFFNWLLGIDISESTKIGDNLVVWHGIGLIVHPSATIGNNVVLRHGTTIGNNRINGKAPIIENNVDIGAGSIIIGDITIGHHSCIGAGSVVTKDVEPYSVVVGNPAKVIKYLNF